MSRGGCFVFKDKLDIGQRRFEDRSFLFGGRAGKVCVSAEYSQYIYILGINVLQRSVNMETVQLLPDIGIAVLLVAGCILALIGLPGNLLILIIGTAVGAVLGGCAAGYAVEYWKTKDKIRARNTAKASAKGQLTGMAVKFVVAVIMSGVVVYKLWLSAL